MLNTTSMAYSHNLSSYMTPSRSRHTDSDAKSIGANNYFVSSIDFEYDLFLKGFVNCDGSRSSAAKPKRESFFSYSFLESPKKSNQEKSKTANSLFNSLTSLTSSRSNGSSLKFINLNRSRPHHTSAVANDYITFLPPSPPPPLLVSPTVINNDCKQSSQTCNTSTTVGNHWNSSSSNTTSPKATAGSGGGGGGNLPLTIPASPAKQTEAGSTTIVVVNQQQQQQQQNQPPDESVSHQHLHALHKFRQKKQKGIISRLRDVVISFTPKERTSIVNRDDLYYRCGPEERAALDSFAFLAQLEDYTAGDDQVDSDPIDVESDRLLSAEELAKAEQLELCCDNQKIDAKVAVDGDGETAAAAAAAVGPMNDTPEVKPSPKHGRFGSVKFPFRHKSNSFDSALSDAGSEAATITTTGSIQSDNCCSKHHGKKKCRNKSKKKAKRSE